MNRKEIEEMANKYAEAENSSYTNDYYGFINGFEKAISLIKQPTYLDTLNKLEKIGYNFEDEKWEDGELLMIIRDVVKVVNK